MHSKLLGQIRLVLLGRSLISDGGSFTLISGYIFHDPIPEAISFAVANGGVEGFVRLPPSASTARPDQRRQPGMAQDSSEQFGPFNPGRTPVPMLAIASAFQRSSSHGVPERSSGLLTGRGVRCVIQLSLPAIFHSGPGRRASRRAAACGRPTSPCSRSPCAPRTSSRSCRVCSRTSACSLYRRVCTRRGSRDAAGHALVPRTSRHRRAVWRATAASVPHHGIGARASLRRRTTARGVASPAGLLPLASPPGRSRARASPPRRQLARSRRARAHAPTRATRSGLARPRRRCAAAPYARAPRRSPPPSAMPPLERFQARSRRDTRARPRRDRIAAVRPVGARPSTSVRSVAPKGSERFPPCQNDVCELPRQLGQQPGSSTPQDAGHSAPPTVSIQ